MRILRLLAAVVAYALGWPTGQRLVERQRANIQTWPERHESGQSPVDRNG